jgi:hypothetical protein
MCDNEQIFSVDTRTIVAARTHASEMGVRPFFPGVEISEKGGSNGQRNGAAWLQQSDEPPRQHAQIS